jgi:hypothetical protein
MLKLLNCIEYHFLTSLCLDVVDVYHTKKTTPTHWRRKRRAAGANVTETAGQVGRNHNSGTAGSYNTNKEIINTRSGQVDDD